VAANRADCSPEITTFSARSTRGGAAAGAAAVSAAADAAAAAAAGAAAAHAGAAVLLPVQARLRRPPPPATFPGPSVVGRVYVKVHHLLRGERRVQGQFDWSGRTWFVALGPINRFGNDAAGLHGYLTDPKMTQDEVEHVRAAFLGNATRMSVSPSFTRPVDDDVTAAVAIEQIVSAWNERRSGEARLSQ
jgi:hypothetical protein